MKLLRRDWSVFLPHSIAGRIIRLPFRLIPGSMALPILFGPAKGYKWVVSSSITSCWFGTYELSLQDMAAKHIRSGMTVCDVGAHVGFFSMIFSRLVGDSGIVHAFEPHAGNTAHLQRHMTMNAIRNVRAWQLALSDTRGYAGFRPAAHSSMGKITNEDADVTAMVAVSTLDELVGSRRIHHPDVVKVDVEGHEVRFLKGAEETIIRHAPIFFIEIHTHENGEMCRGILEDHGYKVTALGSGHENTGSRLPEMIVALPHNRKTGGSR